VLRRRLAADPAGLADRMARLAELDPGRVRLWLFFLPDRPPRADPERPWAHEQAAELDGVTVGIWIAAAEVGRWAGEDDRHH
jgi:hypothetical protein